MIQSNCRVANSKGIVFYEQDILYDDYLFTGDIQITLSVDYRSPGLGIALIADEGMSIYEKSEAYLFKLGYKETSAIHRFGDTQIKLLKNAVAITPYRKDMKFTFTKRGKKITIETDEDGVILQYVLAKPLDKYNIGIYSNAGNVVNSMAIASSVPDKWIVNMKNTNGGYIKFMNNGFEVSDCNENAELIQDGLSLSAGKYYLKYDTTSIKGLLDLKAYVFSSSDKRMYDEDKTILNSDGSFILESNSVVSIKFKGKNGSVKKIQITDKTNDVYVPTRNTQSIIQGSYITIKTEGLSKIEWTGTILDVPNETGTYAVINTPTETIAPEFINVLPKLDYKYAYDVSNYTLKVLDSDGKAVYTTLKEEAKEITIFNNMNSIIKTLVITDDSINPKSTNLIADKTSKKYVPSSITGPIIVTDEDSIPLDLSSSFKIVANKGFDMYLFDNYEREVFEPSEHIKVANKISQSIGSVVVYGIPFDAVVNHENLYRIPKAGINSIDAYTDKYDTIKESDIYSIDRFGGDLYLPNMDSYKSLVVDYLKYDSYCINYNDDLKLYEVDISTDKENLNLLYDVNTSAGNVSTINEYKTTDIIPKSNCYIVLRREEL